MDKPKINKIQEIDNSHRAIAAALDKRKVNYFETDFSFIMDYDLLFQNNLKLNQPYRAKEDRILFITSGNAVMNFNNRDYKLDKGCLLIAPERNVMVIKSLSKDFQARAIAIKLNELEKIHLQTLRVVNIHLSLDDINLVESHFSLINEVISSKRKNSKSIHSIILSLLYNIEIIQKEVSKLFGERFINRQEEIYNQFLDLLNEYGIKRHSIEFYAEKMCISSNYLSKIVKQISHLTVLQWINVQTIKEAKILLKGSELTISEVATAVGFTDTAQFSKFFKKEMDLTPNDYKNN